MADSNIFLDKEGLAHLWSQIALQMDHRADITVDTELSDTSENPVQNKAIKAYIDAKIAEAISGAIGGSY